MDRRNVAPLNWYDVARRPSAQVYAKKVAQSRFCAREGQSRGWQSQSMAELSFLDPAVALRTAKEWHKLAVLSRLCATPFSDLRNLSTGRTSVVPDASTRLYLLYLLSLHAGIGTIQTKGTRDGSGNFHHFRPSTTYSSTLSLAAAL